MTKSKSLLAIEKEDKANQLTQFDVTAESLYLQRSSFSCFYIGSLFPSGDEQGMNSLGSLGYGHNKCLKYFTIHANGKGKTTYLRIIYNPHISQNNVTAAEVHYAQEESRI